MEVRMSSHATKPCEGAVILQMALKECKSQKEREYEIMSSIYIREAVPRTFKQYGCLKQTLKKITSK